MKIIPLTYSHWAEVERIYLEGIQSGQATFETESPGWELWNEMHLDIGRLVAVRHNKVVGWTALTAVSSREVYNGVAEESVYVSSKDRGTGIGFSLLTELIDRCERQGIYSLQAVMYPENTATIKLHEKCGFRKIGCKKKIAKLNGYWRDTLLYERRSKINQ